MASKFLKPLDNLISGLIARALTPIWPVLLAGACYTELRSLLPTQLLDSVHFLWIGKELGRLYPGVRRYPFQRVFSHWTLPN